MMIVHDVGVHRKLGFEKPKVYLVYSPQVQVPKPHHTEVSNNHNVSFQALVIRPRPTGKKKPKISTQNPTKVRS